MNTENTPSIPATPSVVKVAKDNSSNLHIHVNTPGKKGKKRGNGRESNFKCVSSIDGKIIKRVRKEEAERLVKTGGYVYSKRSVWKATVRDIKKHEAPVIAVDEKKGIVLGKKKVHKTDKNRKSKENKDA